LGIVNCSYVSGTPNPDSDSYVGSSDSDKDLISWTIYDTLGRVESTKDTIGQETRFVYDRQNRRAKTIQNYVAQGTSDPADWVWDDADTRWEDGSGNAVDLGAENDENLITEVTYLPKAGDPSPDARDGLRNWLFNPDVHGPMNDRNLISVNTYDSLGRILTAADPIGNTNTTAYFKDGQVESMTDPLAVVSKHRYDKLRRRKLSVAGYLAGSFTDPDTWHWDIGSSTWKDGNNATVKNPNPAVDSVTDRNVMVAVEYDTAGNVSAVRERVAHSGRKSLPTLPSFRLQYSVGRFVYLDVFYQVEKSRVAKNRFSAGAGIKQRGRVLWWF
jgi:YD repeat-containing protein